jgi:hypothetical protein
MYYVVPHGTPITECGAGHHPDAKAFETLGEAKTYADALHASYGNHWHVLRVETVWTTTTLADLMTETR